MIVELKKYYFFPILVFIFLLVGHFVSAGTNEGAYEVLENSGGTKSNTQVGSISTGGDSTTTSTGIDNEDIGIEDSDEDNVHDPGITILEAVPSTATTGTETEDIGLTAPEPETTAVDPFMKIDDIKGESKDETKDEPTEDDTKELSAPVAEPTAGEVRFGDGIQGKRPPSSADDPDDEKQGGLKTSEESGTAARTSKPKEIVVVGSKLREEQEAGEVEVRGWDPKEKKVIISTEDIKTETDLRDYVNAVTLSDENINSIAVRDQVVTIQYPQPAKLFGLFSIQLKTTASVDKDGRVKVKFPWYRIFTKNNKKQLENELKDGAEQAQAMTKSELIESVAKDKGKDKSTAGDDAQLANIDLQNILQHQQRQIQMMSNVMKTLHDTAMAVIRKIGG